jgi:uncharacterized SAM-binding protein YcdF (DUF218 family)
MSYLEPALPLLLFVALAALALSWRGSARNHKPRLMGFSILGLMLLSMNPAAWLLSRPLEMWYGENPIPGGRAEAIVVLAGAVDSPQPQRPYALAAHDTYERIQHAAWLFKKWKALPVLVCGGGQDPESYSQTTRHLLEAEGVPADSIWVDAHSRSTYENALDGSQILRQHGVSEIALVVDARSMPRAAASFRKQGIRVVPVPIRFYDLNPSFEDILPTWRAIQSNGETAHEIVGLLWFWVRGWI